MKKSRRHRDETDKPTDVKKGRTRRKGGKLPGRLPGGTQFGRIKDSVGGLRVEALTDEAAAGADRGDEPGRRHMLGG